MIAAVLALALGQATLEREASEAGSALAICAVPRAQEASSGSGSAEAIAEAAITACTEPQARIRSLFARYYGDAGADARLQEFMAQYRTRLIRVVNARRGLVARPDTPETAWGDCVRARASELASRAGGVGTHADEAMQHCAREEAAVRAHLGSGRGAGSTDELMAPIRTIARDMAIQTIERLRAGRR